MIPIATLPSDLVADAVRLLCCPTTTGKMGRSPSVGHGDLPRDLLGDRRVGQHHENNDL